MSTDAFPSTSNEEATMANLAQQVDVENPRDQDMAARSSAEVVETQLPPSRLSVPPKHFERPKSSHEVAGAGFTFGKPTGWNGNLNRHFKSALSMVQENESTPPSAQPIVEPEPAKKSNGSEHLPHIVNGNIITPFPNVSFGISAPAKNAPTIETDQPSFPFSSIEKTQVQLPVPASMTSIPQPSTQSDFGTPLTGLPLTNVHSTQAKVALDKTTVQMKSPPVANRGQTRLQPNNREKHADRTPMVARDYFRTYNAQQYQLQEQTLQAVVKELERSQEEVADLDEKLITLSEAYKKLQVSIKEKDSAIASHDSEKKRLQVKAQKLQDFVNGLGNDYNRLRDTARSLQTQREGLNAAEKEELSRCQTLTAKYKGQVDTLQQMVAVLQNQQNAQSLDQNNALALEQLDKVATDLYLRLRNDFAEQCTKLTDKIDDINARPNASQAITVGSSSNYGPKVDECLHLLHDLASRDHVLPQHINKLDENMKGYARSINTSLQAYQSEVSQSNSVARRMADATLKELNMLCSSSTKANVLQEQVIEYREQTAASSEKVHGVELQLAEARCKIQNMQDKLDDRSRALQDLQAEAVQIRARPQQAPELLLRIADLQSACKDVEAQKAVVDKRVHKLAQQVKDKQSACESLEDNLSGLQLQVEAAAARENELRKEQAKLMEDFENQRQADRELATKAAESRFTKLNQQFTNEKMQAKAELDAAKERLVALKEKIGRMSKEDGAQGSKKTKLEQALVKVQSELSDLRKTQTATAQKQREETQAFEAREAALKKQLDKALEEKEDRARQLLAARALQFNHGNTAKAIIGDSQDYGISQLQEISRRDMSDTFDEPDFEFAYAAIPKIDHRPAVEDSQALDMAPGASVVNQLSHTVSTHFAQPSQPKSREHLATPTINKSSQNSQSTPKRPLKQTQANMSKRAKLTAQPQQPGKPIVETQSPTQKVKTTRPTKARKKTTIFLKEEKMKQAFLTASQEK